MLTIGIIGCNEQLAQTYKNAISAIPNCICAGIATPDENLSQLTSISDVLCITSDVSISTIASILKQCKHVFLDKPFTLSSGEYQQLSRIANEANVSLYISNTVCVHPLIELAHSNRALPAYIEINNIDNNKGLESLLFSNIGIALKLAKADLRKVNAVGVSKATNAARLASVNIEFNNGCMANLNLNTIKRVATHQVSVYYYLQGCQTLDLISGMQNTISNNTCAEKGEVDVVKLSNLLSVEMVRYIKNISNNNLNEEQNILDTQIIIATQQIQKKLTTSFSY